MKRESLAFLISGTFFGLLVGWILGSQQRNGGPTPAGVPVAAAQTRPRPRRRRPRRRPWTSSAPASSSGRRPRSPPTRMSAWSWPTCTSTPRSSISRFLGTRPALKLDPKDVNASTDLGVCYYYTDQVDRALAQFDRSLALDPRHVKTLFNQGVVRAFGKRDLKGAEESWQRVVAIAPDSEEGLHAKQGLDGLRSGHAGGAGDAPKTGAGTGGHVAHGQTALVSRRPVRPARDQSRLVGRMFSRCDAPRPGRGLAPRPNGRAARSCAIRSAARTFRSRAPCGHARRTSRCSSARPRAATPMPRRRRRATRRRPGGGAGAAISLTRVAFRRGAARRAETGDNIRPPPPA